MHNQPKNQPAAPRPTFPVVVHVVLQSKAGIFLLRRAHSGFLDGWYGLPGGHLERGESLHQAAQRECREETGTLPLRLRPVAVYSYRSEQSADSGQGLNFIFAAGAGRKAAPGIGEPDKFDHCGFYAPARLPTNTIPWVQDVAQMTLRPMPTLKLREYVWD